VEAALLEQTHEQVEPRQKSPEARPKVVRPISPAEKRILNLAVKGMTDKEICRELDLSITTVRTHWTRLRRKLGVVNRAQAIAESLEMESGPQLRLLQARIRAMHRALNQKGLGVWEWHPECDRVIADELSSRMFNGQSDEHLCLFDFLRCIPSEDQTLLAEHLREGVTPSAEGICHRLRLQNSRQVQVRTKVTRVMQDDRTIVVCTTEPV
jgi:DNA-binding CsgD family transcriptional regulator